MNAEQVQLELSEYNEIDVMVDKKDTIAAVEVAKEVEKQVENYSKIKKLNKKLVLVPGTEAIEQEKEKEKEEIKKPKPKTKTQKKKLIIEEE